MREEEQRAFKSREAAWLVKDCGKLEPKAFEQEKWALCLHCRERESLWTQTGDPPRATCASQEALEKAVLAMRELSGGGSAEDKGIIRGHFERIWSIGEEYLGVAGELEKATTRDPKG